MDGPTLPITGDRPPFIAAPLDKWGPFRLLRKVGQGGCGEVYLGWDPKLQREVAVKLLLPDIFGGACDENAVLREARLMAHVRHPNVVSVHGVGQWDDRVGFWTDFVHGETLARILEKQGVFGWREATLVGIEVCKALHAVHHSNLLHRDIKPRNVMREEGGRILLMDFGLSSQSDADTAFEGTLSYMAPELLSHGKPTVRSDIYSVGVLLFELVTKRFPITHDQLEGIVKRGAPYQRCHLLDIQADLPEAFARVVEKALDVNPAERYASAGQMVAALSGVLGGGNSGVQPSYSSPKHKTTLAVLLGIGISCVAALVLVFSRDASIPAIHLPPHTSIRMSPAADDLYRKADKLLYRYDIPGNLNEATGILQRLSASSPGFALAYAGVGRAYYLQYLSNPKPDLIEKIKVACEAASRLQDLPSTHVTLGMLAKDLGDNELAAQEIEQALKLDSRSAEAYGALAELYSKQGRAADVQPAFQRARDLAPDDWRWPNRLGIYYLSEGKFDEAAEQFNRTKSITPDNSRPYNNLGLIYLKQGKLAQAEIEFTRAIALVHGPNATFSLGATLLFEGKHDEAIALFQRATKDFPGEYRAWSNLGAAYQWNPNTKTKARGAFQTAAALAEARRATDPANPILLADLASYCAYLDLPLRSLPLIRRAIALAPNDPEVQLRAGETYELVGRRDDALMAVRKALQLGIGRLDVEMNPDFQALRLDPRLVVDSSAVR